jgi:hypothetical protein
MKICEANGNSQHNTVQTLQTMYVFTASDATLCRESETEMKRQKNYSEPSTLDNNHRHRLQTFSMVKSIGFTMFIIITALKIIMHHIMNFHNGAKFSLRN